MKTRGNSFGINSHFIIISILHRLVSISAPLFFGAYSCVNTWNRVKKVLKNSPGHYSGEPLPVKKMLL